jgi:predicted dehydrogenase
MRAEQNYMAASKHPVSGSHPKRREFLFAAGASPLAAGAVAAQGTSPAGGEKPVGVGLIGCGGRGSHLIQTARQLNEVGVPAEVVAVCDIYQPRLERLATRMKAKEYSRSAELVRDPRVNAVIVATPDRLHVHHALEAVRAGKDVYCEKPLTHWAQFDKLKELVREVRARKTVFQVGAQWVSDPIWARAAEQIKSGAIGKVVHAQTGYFRHGDSGERGMPIDDPNAQAGRGLDWDAFQSDAPRRDFTVSRFFQWRMYADYSGGPATDLYPHPLTRLLKALGVGMPKKVVAFGGKFFYDGNRDVPDTFDMLIEYPQGMTVSLLGTIVNDTMIETVIRGSEGTVRFSGEAQLSVSPQPGAPERRRTIATDRTGLDHMRDFIECVRTRQRTMCDIELGYGVQTALIMGMRSYVEGRVAYFDAEKEEIRMS